MKFLDLRNFYALVSIFAEDGKDEIISGCM